MAAVLREAGAVNPQLRRHSLHVPRQSNDFVDRRALIDVTGLLDNAPVQASDEEIWMISYMDIMTLLLTLFVLLLAYAKATPQAGEVVPSVKAAQHASVAKPKAPQAVARTVAAAPTPTPPSRAKAVAADALISLESIMPAHASILLIESPQPRLRGTDIHEAAPQPAASDTKASRVAATLADIAPPVDAVIPPLRTAPQITVPLRQEPSTPTPPAAVTAREALLESLRTSPLGQRVELSADQDNVSLEISDDILFDPGSAGLKQNGRPLLDELAKLLGAQDYTVSVEGHSDNMPFANARFASNWELSATRATNVTRYLIGRGIAAARLRAIGYADTRPRADNASVQGRARNRRVSLVLHMPVQPQAVPAQIRSGNNQGR